MRRFSFTPTAVATPAQVEAMQIALTASGSQLAQAIATAKAEAIETAQTQVNAAKTELTSALDSRATSLLGTIDAKEEALATAIAENKQDAITEAQNALVTARQALQTEINANKITADTVMAQTAQEIATNGLTDEQQTLLIQGVTDSVAELEAEKVARAAADVATTADLSGIRTDLENLNDDTIEALEKLGVMDGGVVTFPHPDSKVQDNLDNMLSIANTNIDEVQVSNSVASLAQALDNHDDAIDNDSVSLSDAVNLFNAYAIHAGNNHRVSFNVGANTYSFVKI